MSSSHQVPACCITHAAGDFTRAAPWRQVRPGTDNMVRAPAMTEEDMEAAFRAGEDAVARAHEVRRRRGQMVVK